MINFISNLPKDLRSGGFSAMNAAAYSAISSLEPTIYVGPINPPVSMAEKVLSKFRRVAGSQGNFFFFSRRRLNQIADAVHAQTCTDARLDFFHGFTPWILTRPQRPYIAWSDCTFHDYIDIFHRREQFCSDDLDRIEQAEAAWLKNASRIIFTSQWASERAVRDYSLDASRVASVGIFGEMEMPARDAYAGDKYFAFVSTNFETKGGLVVLAAFHEVRKRHPDAHLTIIGHRPPGLVKEAGADFVGYLRKEVPQEYQRFQQILCGARALVNASRSDTCPVLLIEAGYAGCPVISSRKFAIPEIVDHGRTGLLLEDSSSPRALAEAMVWMLENDGEYFKMREATWSNARQLHSRQKFEERLQACVRDNFPLERLAAQ